MFGKPELGEHVRSSMRLKPEVLQAPVIKRNVGVLRWQVMGLTPVEVMSFRMQRTPLSLESQADYPINTTARHSIATEWP